MISCYTLCDNVTRVKPDVEELRFARQISVTYEAIRKWCRQFGQQYANAVDNARDSSTGDTLSAGMKLVVLRE